MTLSAKTRVNWLLDAKVFLTALIATLSGIYFLYFPIGGFQGGRNPYFGVTVMFERATWDDIHTWSGVLMIIAALIHLIYHWSWVRMMVMRLTSMLSGSTIQMSRGAKVNLIINALIGVGFLVSALSGVYFLFQPRGVSAISGQPIDVLFTPYVWDLIHTWSSVTFVLAGVAHFIIHWKWIDKVTRRVFNIHPNPVVQRQTQY